LQEADLSLLLLTPPLLGLAIFALGGFVPRWLFAVSLLFVTCAGVAILDRSARQDDQTMPVVYASLDADPAPQVDAPEGPFGFDRRTAVYDISAHTVYLPNGLKLEAHSGLGPRLDDPRYVHERMRGATPPNVYELTLREKPFHGVRALRLAPVERDKVFGRSGLLAHSYMLGPRGDSNGCVVFKNYGAFLQAFESGELKRLAVVARLGAEIAGPAVAPWPSGQDRHEPAARLAASNPTPRNDPGALPP
jgi:Protein of unknown function (DUF2778)